MKRSVIRDRCPPYFASAFALRASADKPACAPELPAGALSAEGGSPLNLTTSGCSGRSDCSISRITRAASDGGAVSCRCMPAPASVAGPISGRNAVISDSAFR